MQVGTKMSLSPAALRIIQILCLLVILGGTVLASGTSASTGGGCDRICSTFCPTDPDDYCDQMGCGAGGSCADKTCIMPGYEFAKTISCGSGGGDGGGDLY
ncbi:MAG: hypothetical protein F4X22_08310 [Gemmatimonadales bacterium]|nr:hypothetical protein [Gammaproteobacteria bacterium]MYC88222.1 hypothetical protein [Candidatus Palauibacter denitrificans]